MPPTCNHTPPAPESCYLCKLYMTRPDYRRAWDGEPAAPATRPRIPTKCVHLGPILERQNCACEGKHIRACAKHGKTTIGDCYQCKDFEEKAKMATFPLRFDEHNFVPWIGGKRFNSSLISFKDGFLIAFRTGWCGSEIYLARLDSSFRALACHKLELFHSHAANYGREDPRLFWFRGRLHVAFIGVVGPKEILYTNQLYARLNEDLQVEAIFVPQYPARNYWEKNWQFFEYQDELYASYSIAPHRVLRVRDNNAELVYSSPTRGEWSGGELRGGSAPVLVDDEWWCFFHSRVEVHGHRIYNTGVLTFENRPPFQILRLTPHPILAADPATKPPDQYASVVFAGGAALVGDTWIVSHGIHDRWTELHSFSRHELEKQMVQIAWKFPRKEQVGNEV